MTVADIDIDQFTQDFAEIAAKQLQKIPQADRENAMYQLQDATSLFSPYTYGLLVKALGDHPSEVVRRAEEMMRKGFR